ncbi:MAG: NAD-dependent epimerase/dehydratase family protein, partial [Pirellulales bacterium]
MSLDLADYRVTVTGGAGFLGQAVVKRLADRGVTKVAVPRRSEYDLVHEADAGRMYDDLRPDVVLHLAGEVGGIGANRANPGRYFYANMAMALNLIEQARARGIR